MTAGSNVFEILLARAGEVLAEFAPGQEPTISDGAAVVAYSGETGTWALIAGTFPDDAVLVVYSALGEPVPKACMPELFEYFARVNDGLPRGNFELDFAQRLVRVRTSLDVADVDVAELDASGMLKALISRLVLANVATMDLFLPGLRAVVAGELSPEDADAMAERS